MKINQIEMFLNIRITPKGETSPNLKGATRDGYKKS